MASEPEELAERGPGIEVAEVEVAEADLLIQRDDLGTDAFTLIAAGDPIPATLAGLPRQPRTPEPTKRRR